MKYSSSAATKPSTPRLIIQHPELVEGCGWLQSNPTKKEFLKTSLKNHTMAWVYIIKCSDGSYYTGSTVDLEKRLAEHQEGTFDGYTAKRLPVKLVFSQETPTDNEAFLLEHQIKGWSRAKKEALIRGDYYMLPDLSRCHSKVKNS